MEGIARKNVPSYLPDMVQTCSLNLGEVIFCYPLAKEKVIKSKEGHMKY